MSKEALMKIKEAEAHAEEIIADAGRRAAQMLESAEASGKELCDRVESESLKRQKAELAALEEKLLASAKETEEQDHAELELLRKDATLRRKTAEKIVARGIDEKCR